ncbi:General negative regulator of transcription subunit 3 [Neolecta irregularis DAH-3]|uniref:General negative regulator of transcription subunit 3 n=1 Tax=Neolecta irregularis (strain DAH-3) TaxID=1198029 RepID=A0A1U7LMJ3_NEOID|nr:General negative regulator of transcription subunit 3 [Neolecta irregularis DAH-3]|eukprot:OLL23848.1 General negative regulator of transcription subunit 3 [Neolecta irregularis DAH-3]
MAQRKLQAEHDKLTKKVNEGMLAFEAIYEKLATCQNPSQKDKLEVDLKKEIKKLQRSRDTLKSWLAGSDFKDKRPLMEQRKMIEAQMEKFKVVEKEIKTKAFSKEGLQAGVRLDPKEKEKAETAAWVSSMVEELERQDEQAEAEQELLQVAMKKSKRDASKAERFDEISQCRERHKWHINKLELILRLLENGQLDAEQVQNIKDDVQYYVESNQDPDFAEDDAVYDSLNLSAEEDIYGLDKDADSTQDERSVADEQPPTPQKDNTELRTSHSTVPRRAGSIAKSPIMMSAVAHPPLLNGALKPIQTPATVKPLSEPLKYASAAAAAAAAQSSSVTGIQPLPPPPGTGSRKPSLVRSPSTTVSPSTSKAVPVVNDVVASDEPKVPEVETEQVQETVQVEPVIEQKSTMSPVQTPEEIPRVDQEPFIQAEDEASIMLEEPCNAEPQGTTLPPGLQDLISSYENAKRRSASIDPADCAQARRMFTHSSMQAPEANDAQKAKFYAPKDSIQVPLYYPQTPLPVFDDPEIYERVDVDTLFYIFYYQQGTYHQ